MFFGLSLTRGLLIFVVEMIQIVIFQQHTRHIHMVIIQTKTHIMTYITCIHAQSSESTQEPWRPLPHLVPALFSSGPLSLHLLLQS